MQRTTGAYKRKVQTALFVTGLIAAALLNVDAVRITQILYRDPDIRKAAADFAVETARSHPAPAAQPAPGGQPAPTPQPATAAQAASATPLAPTAMPGTNSELSTTEARQQLSGEIRQLRELTRIGFPIGWVTPRYMNFVPVTVDPAQRTDAWKEVAILSKLLGLLATAFAVCLGAPFWFDILNKLVKLRSSGGSDAKSSNPSAPDAAAGAASGAPAGFPPGGSAPATAPLGTAAALAAVPRAEPPEFGAALAVPSVAFSTAKALRLAEASRLAYDKPLQGDDKEKDDTFVTYAKENWLAKSQTLLTDAATGTEVGVALLGDVAVIACRGTEPDKIKDWQTDASCVLKAAAADPAKSLPAFPGLIHTGFHEAFCAVYPKIKAWLAAFPEKDRTFVLYVTGHSLGAAIGTLVAYQLEQERFHRVQGVYTYGSPRVGNPAFASGYAALLGDRTYRVVNNEDLVTRVPPTLPAKLDYKHVGEMVYIDDAGRLQRDIGFWYRALNFTENAVRLGVLDAVKVTAGDHDMLKYIAWLKQAARTQPAV